MNFEWQNRRGKLILYIKINMIIQNLNTLTVIVGVIICPIHGDFEQVWSAHFHNKAGCPKCAIRKQCLPKH